MPGEADCKLTFIDLDNDHYQIEFEIPESQKDILKDDKFNLNLNSDQLPDEVDAGVDITHWEFVVTVGDLTKSGVVTTCDPSHRNISFEVDSRR